MCCNLLQIRDTKGTWCIVHLNRQQFQTNKYSLLPCKKLSFLSENFRAFCKYGAMGAMETIQGTVQEGNIPARMEVVFVTTFLRQKFTNIFKKDL